MGKDTNRFNKVIENLHKKAYYKELGISSTLQNCKYEHIKSLEGRRLFEVPNEILAECNFQEYRMARSWNQAKKHNTWRYFGDEILEFFMTPIRYLTFEYHHSKALKSF